MQILLDLLEKEGGRVGLDVNVSKTDSMASGYVSIKHGLKGPNIAVVTACTTGTHNIGLAATVWANDSTKITGEVDGCRVYERLESCKFNTFKSHGLRIP